VQTFAVFVAALGTALATGLGALPFLAVRRPPRSWLGVANGFAAGFMLGASAGLCVEGVKTSGVRTAIGVLVGVAFLVVTRRLLQGRGPTELGTLKGGDALRALLVIGVMTVHSFSEGVGVGVAFGGGETLGVLIAVAIAVHNIPEGLAISLVLVPRGATVRTAAAWSIFSSLPQPLMAVPAYIFVESFAGFLPVGLGFAAGAMLWLAAADLLPEAMRTTRPATVVAATGSAAAAMLVFQLILL
jgi:zinc transporter ZupT